MSTLEDGYYREVEDLQRQVESLSERLLKARNCCAQRGAKMQLMRVFFREVDWRYFLEEHPEAQKWFDEDRVPR